MDPAWRQELQDRGLPAEVVTFFENEGITTAARFANYLDSRDEVMPVIVSKLHNVPNPRSIKGALTELWREVDHAESLRLQRKAQGLKQDDLEDPLPDHVGEGLRQRFLERYRFSLSLNESLCEPIVGRVKREIDRKCHTLISVDRCRSARESARDSAGKHLKVGASVSLHFDTTGSSKGPRTVPSVMVYLQLLELLLVGGYAFVGNFLYASSNTIFCSMQVVRDYLSFVRAKVAPLTGQLQPLSALRRADEDTRTLWAEAMREGKSFDEAVKSCEAKVAALWLFAHPADVTSAQALVDLDPSPKRRKREEDPNAPKVASVDSSGKSLCRLWNDGKCNPQSCKHGRQHSCNYLTKAGVACGQPHRRCEHHK